MQMWVNPSCSKCARALDTLESAGVGVEQRRYLDEPPTWAELDEVLRRLNIEPWDVARLAEPVAVELGLADWPRDRARWIGVLVEHPVLLQRPILLLDDGTAVLGRTDAALRDAVERSGR
ncbi:MAG: arsenate reductase family protein [Actinomycetota bacterium]|nr:arsenate reductase family protein [Actinomycetota bacterium]